MPINNAWNIHWLNQNANRNYPISEDVSRLDITNTITLPNDFIVDLSLTYTGDLDASWFHILSINKNGTSIHVVLGYDSGTVASIAIDINTFTRNQSYFLSGTGNYYDSVGTIVIGSLEGILELPDGLITFVRENTKLESTTVRQLNRGVTLLSIDNDTPELNGDVTLNIGSNIRLDTYKIGNVTYLKLNAVSTSGLTADCENCDGSTTQKTQIISINGIPPDINGNIDLLGDTCLQIQSLPTGLKFIDLCSQPCCGCEELTVINSDFTFLREAVDSVNSVSSKLEGEVFALSMNLISSQTDDLPSDVMPMVDSLQALLDYALTQTDCNQPC